MSSVAKTLVLLKSSISVIVCLYSLVCYYYKKHFIKLFLTNLCIILVEQNRNIVKYKCSLQFSIWYMQTNRSKCIWQAWYKVY